ncbi:MAG: ATP-dependent 6-phosphofructokinase [Deltaproteobacteria bacterium]|nr:ATP-dependent 6-phosphofructokinase [Deltaproteobacteria bacterium]
MDTTVESLGECKIDTHLNHIDWVEDTERVLYDVSAEAVEERVKQGKSPISFLKAGPRRKIYFDLSKLKCAIVTCGGLCPGLNNVIRSIVLTLYHTYGVRNILGIRYGLQGFIPKYGHTVLELTPDMVSEINELGGTILSSSRGHQDVGEIADALERMNIGILFMVGGDGTFRAAAKISEEVADRGSKIAIIGIPKTIDNDILFLSRSFGFSTAVSCASDIIGCAHVEANGAPNGIGLVKLMGRQSGFIAANAALDRRYANFVLIPESDFDLEGPYGFLAVLEKRILEKKHAVIVVAEGAGQQYCSVDGFDKSGNKALGDIGLYLRDRINQYFKEKGIEINLKYIDPSYTIRSVRAQNAVHVGVAGKTNIMVGTWNGEFVCVPLGLVTTGRKQVDLKGKLWSSVLEATGQPSFKPPNS